MTFNVIDVFTTAFVKKLIREYIKKAQVQFDNANKLPDANKLLALSDGNTYMEFSRIYQLINTCMNAINGLGIAIEKLPDKQEFESIKTELKNQRIKIKENVELAKKEHDEQIKRRKGGASIYH